MTTKYAAHVRTAAMDFPLEGELVVTSRYKIRVSAAQASAVEISIDGGPWKPCQSDGEDAWSYDWSGYAAGGHMVCARITFSDKKQEVLRPRAVRVALPPQGAVGLRNIVATDIGRALSFIRDSKVHFVQLWFTDVGGKPWRISLPTEHFDEAAFSGGVTLDGPSTSLSFKSYINLLPDPNAVFLDPLATVPTAAIMCDLLEPPGAAPAPLGVRQTLRSAAAALGQIETGLTATLGAEAEFFLIEEDGKPSPEEDVWAFICELARTLQEAGIKSEGFRFGPAKGQGRVQMRWTDPVRTADHILLYRWFARTLARRRGKKLTFQPRPIAGEGAASMPVHHTLWLGAQNAFHDPKGWQYTSETCRHYVGGIIKHAGAVSAFVGVTKASYPLKAGSQESVIRPFLSAHSPEALCRVPERQLYASGRRVKFRAGNAGANPYLSFAATILAGVDGLKNKIAPVFEPTGKMPGSLDEALKAADKDRGFLIEGGFTDALIDAWIAHRTKQPETSAVEA